MLYPFFGKNTIINQPSNNNIFTLDEIKQYLNIPTISTAKDNELTMLLNMAVEEFCDISQGSILNTTYKSQLYGFHNFDKNYNNYFYTNNVIRIKRQFIHTVNSIKYLSNGVMTTLPSTEYNVDCQPFYVDIVSLNENGFPKVDEFINNIQKLGTVEVEFIAGFGTTKASIPDKIKRALLSYITYFYTNKGDCNGCGDANAQFSQIAGEYLYYYGM